MRSPASVSTRTLRRGGSLAPIGEPSTAPDRTCPGARVSGGHRAQPIDHPIGAAAQLIEIERLGRRAVRRPAEQVALAGADAERPDDLELVRGLDALGHDERAPAVGEVAEGPDDLERRIMDRATLDQRQVDLDDVEAELAEKPQAGVAGPDVVGGETDAG